MCPKIFMNVVLYETFLKTYILYDTLFMGAINKVSLLVPPDIELTNIPLKKGDYCVY